MPLTPEEAWDHAVACLPLVRAVTARTYSWAPPQAREDIISEAILKLQARLLGYDPSIGNPRSYALRLARYAVIDAGRQQVGKELPAPAEDAGGTVEGIEDPEDAWMSRADVQAWLADLPPELLALAWWMSKGGTRIGWARAIRASPTTVARYADRLRASAERAGLRDLLRS